MCDITTKPTYPAIWFPSEQRWLADDPYNRRYVAVTEKARKVGHTCQNIGTGMMDQLECLCGWLSRGYFDGAEYAWTEWEKHVTPLITDLPDDLSSLVQALPTCEQSTEGSYQ